MRIAADVEVDVYLVVRKAIEEGHQNALMDVLRGLSSGIGLSHQPRLEVQVSEARQKMTGFEKRQLRKFLTLVLTD